jgi:type III pantothenate kinase
MTQHLSTAECLIAADVGNSSIKVGIYARDGDAGFPAPLAVHELSSREPDLGSLWQWLPPPPCNWFVSSVFRRADQQLRDAIGLVRPRDDCRLLTWRDFPLEIDLPRPDLVGADRLAGAVGANLLRSPDRSALIVDAGSAITVDAVSPAGVLLGGAILPGMNLAARVLSEETDLLPWVDPDDEQTLPHPLGRSTREAIRSGIYWGACGAVRELLARIGGPLPGEPQIFVSGGANRAFVPVLVGATFVPHLVLGGIVTAARHVAA